MANTNSNRAQALAGRLGAGLMTLAIAGTAGVAANAQSRPAGPSADAGEVVVTARRRVEDPHNVPMALTVFGGTKLARQNIYSLNQLQQQEPSLLVVGPNPRNTNFNIRGLGAAIGQFSDGLDNGVGIYIDDV
jgi:iron complex outermembrane receptor protein